MTYTTYSAAQAATRARQYSTWRTGYCLNFVRNMLTPTVSSPFGGLYDAEEAWQKAQKKVTSGVAPAGAPVYWDIFAHDFDHIALSIGGGYCRSTDWPGKGQVGTVSIARLSAAWGGKYLGWSRDYAGLAIKGLELSTGTSTIPAPVNYSEATAIVVDDEDLRVGRMSDSARQFNQRVWSWLYWHGGTSGRNWCIQNYKLWMAEPSALYGSMSGYALRKMYAILAYREPKGGWGGSLGATWPGPALLRRLGLRAD